MQDTHRALVDEAEEMLQRMETVRIEEGTQLAPMTNFMYRLKRLPVRFTTAA